MGLLPLDTSIWLDDLLSRIFTMLENLEAPETRADTSSTVTAGGLSLPTSSFLIDKQSVFRCILICHAMLIADMKCMLAGMSQPYLPLGLHILWLAFVHARLWASCVRHKRGPTP